MTVVSVQQIFPLFQQFKQAIDTNQNAQAVQQLAQLKVSSENVIWNVLSILFCCMKSG